jgi:mono/diheme cytochrome c family protein
MTPKTLFASMIAALAGAVLLHAGASVQTTGPTKPPLVLSSMYGRDLFEFYCASCHGRDGTGGGPVVQALRVPPPDLTRIAARNGGTFPRAGVQAFVTGDKEVPPAHGSKEMPVWGPIFRDLDANDKSNRVRIANIVDYIASIQAK